MRYYLDLVKIITRYVVNIAWYEIIITWCAIIITLYAILKRNNVISITRNAIVVFQSVILTRDKSYFSRENEFIWRDTNFSRNVSRDNAIYYTTRVIHHVIRAFISRDIEPDMFIWGFSFIFEMDAEYKAVSVSIFLCESDIPNVHLPEGEVRV